MAKISRFASLMGSFSAKRAEDDKDDKPNASEKPVQREDESDEDYQDRLKKWEDEDKDDGDKDGKKAEGPYKDVDDNEQKMKGARTAGRAEGAAAERDRWATVLSDPAAEGKASVACDLLAETDMDAAAITKTLGKIGAIGPARSTLASRTNGQPTPAPKVEGDANPTPKKGEPGAFAQSMAEVMAKVNPPASKAS